MRNGESHVGRLVALAAVVLFGVGCKEPLAPVPAISNVCSGEDAPASSSLPTGAIVFSGWRDGDWEIYAMNADGSNLVNLTNHPAADLRPAWSSDGIRIAFERSQPGGAWDSEIYVMNADGSDPVRLIEGSHPEWSPDGERIAFWRLREDDSFWGITTDIWVVDVDGSDARRLMTDAGDPAWSPDGTKIAFTRGSLIEVMDVDDADVVTLVRGSQPAWSPDGKRIAFVDQPGTNSDIYVMEVDGTNRVRLTEHPARDREPAWSPDGTTIAFVSQRDGDREVYLMSVDGSNLLNLTNAPSCGDDHPSWSPAG